MQKTLLLFSLLSSPSPAASLSLLPSSLKRRLPAFLGGPKWYEAGLDFSCTGCGKCCRMDGDIWVNPEEARRIAGALGVEEEVFREKYTRPGEAGSAGKGEKRWWSLKKKESAAGGAALGGAALGGATLSSLAPSLLPLPPLSSSPAAEDGGCIFLDAAGQCGIYEARPVQCETYPFWPSLVEGVEEWESEAAIPDGEPLPAVAAGAAAGDEGDRDAEDDELPPSPRYWSLQHGGCEGINHSSAGIVEKEEIEEKRRRARKHWRSFPDKEIRMTSWYL